MTRPIPTPEQVKAQMGEETFAKLILVPKQGSDLYFQEATPRLKLVCGPRARANVVSDCMYDAAKDIFTFTGCSVVDNNHSPLVACGDFNIWFKVVGPDGKPSWNDTQVAASYRNQEEPNLFGMKPRAHNLVVTCMLNHAGTEMIASHLMFPYGDGYAWEYALTEDGFGDQQRLVDPRPSLPVTGLPKITPRKKSSEAQG